MRTVERDWTEIRRDCARLREIGRAHLAKDASAVAHRVGDGAAHRVAARVLIPDLLDERDDAVVVLPVGVLAARALRRHRPAVVLRLGVGRKGRHERLLGEVDCASLELRLEVDRVRRTVEEEWCAAAGSVLAAEAVDAVALLGEAGAPVDCDVVRH